MSARNVGRHGGLRMKLQPHDLDRIVALTLGHYEQRAEGFRDACSPTPHCFMSLHRNCRGCWCNCVPR